MKLHKKLIKMQNAFGKEAGRAAWIQMKKDLNTPSPQYGVKA
jgi:hypothetical protein